MTAASRGLGLLLRGRFAADGAKVALAARSADALHGLSQELSAGPGEAKAFPFDLSDAKAPEDLVSAVVKEWGRLDAVVVNAPGPPSGFAHRLSDDDWQSAIDLVLMSAVRLAERRRRSWLNRVVAHHLHLTIVERYSRRWSCLTPRDSRSWAWPRRCP